MQQRSPVPDFGFICVRIVSKKKAEFFLRKMGFMTNKMHQSGFQPRTLSRGRDSTTLPKPSALMGGDTPFSWEGTTLSVSFPSTPTVYCDPCYTHIPL